MSMVRFSNEKVFSVGSTYPRHKLKARIIAQKLIEYECEDCENDGDWNGKKLVLQLDHKNGINNDHRLENLRFLCPNCHSQTENYAGKNSKGMRTKDPEPTFKQVKKERDQAIWLEIKADPAYKLGEWGWRSRVANRIGISAQKVNKWVTRVDPSLTLGD